MDSKSVIARFQAERQALALMDHSCVAKVFESGVTERGRPFFVMELVRGAPITEHCDRHRLTIEQRIDLFIQVCEAIQHAHTKGVIHRDIKPSNILVEYESGRSMPKVIDFGVAKALSQRLTEATVFTMQGQLVGTPAYMSPEQAEMGAQDIDTRSDVYSLGIVLYELLTGAPPFEPEMLQKAGFAEIQRILREVEPTRPSTKVASASQAEHGARTTSVAEVRRTEIRTLHGALRRDLDWVVMKCLEKDRGRRYDTASALAEELKRYRRDEPLLAGPPGVGYRARKFIRRNRRFVAVAAALGLTMFVALGGMGYGFAKSRQANSYLRERLDQSAELSEALIQAGNNLRGVDWPSGSFEAFQIAYERATEDFGAESEPALTAASGYATALVRLSRYEEAMAIAEPLYLRTLDVYGDTAAETLNAKSTVAWIECLVGNCDRSIELYKEVLEVKESIFPEASFEVERATQNVVYGLHQCGRFEEAVGWSDLLLRRGRLIWDQHPNEIRYSEFMLGESHLRLGNAEQAAELLANSYDNQLILHRNFSGAPLFSRLLGALVESLILIGDYEGALVRIHNAWIATGSEVLLTHSERVLESWRNHDQGSEAYQSWSARMAKISAP